MKRPNLKDLGLVAMILVPFLGSLYLYGICKMELERYHRELSLARDVIGYYADDNNWVANKYGNFLEISASDATYTKKGIVGGAIAKRMIKIMEKK